MATRVHILTCAAVVTLTSAAQAGMFSRLRGDKPAAPARPQENAADNNDVGAARVRFERKWEPREQAYSFLVPAAWIVEGGIFHANPAQAGGTANSIDGKCDMAVKKDAAGTVMFRWLPTWNYCDMSQNAQFRMTAGMFPVGSRYQGMEVRPMPDYAGFLQGLFRSLHPTATDVNVVELKPMPELGDVFRTINKGVDDQVRMLGFGPTRYDAGGMTVEYAENGTRFREGLVTCLVDLRAPAAMWNNQQEWKLTPVRPR